MLAVKVNSLRCPVSWRSSAIEQDFSLASFLKKKKKEKKSEISSLGSLATFSRLKWVKKKEKNKQVEWDTEVQNPLQRNIKKPNNKQTKQRKRESLLAGFRSERFFVSLSIHTKDTETSFSLQGLMRAHLVNVSIQKGTNPSICC